MDFATERGGPQSTKVLGIYGTAEVEATLAGKMLKILHSEKLRVKCGLGEGKYIKAVEFHKQSTTRNEILSSHEKYVTTQGRVDLSGTWIRDLHEQVLLIYMLIHMLSVCYFKIDFIKL